MDQTSVGKQSGNNLALEPIGSSSTLVRFSPIFTSSVQTTDLSLIIILTLHKQCIDYRSRSRLTPSPTLASSSTQLWTNAEINAIVDEAHRQGAKVAVHASTHQALHQLYVCWTQGFGVDSIEHGHQFVSDEGLGLGLASLSIEDEKKTIDENENEAYEKIASMETYWSPTLATYETVGGEAWGAASRTFKGALAWNDAQLTPSSTSKSYSTFSRDKMTDGRIQFACGGDTGVFAHGENSKELIAMVKLGAKPLDVLSWATLNGWRCIRSPLPPNSSSPSSSQSLADYELELAKYRVAYLKAAKRINRKVTRAQLGDNAVPFGAIRPGFAADIIALGGSTGSLEKGGVEGFAESVSATNVRFVMKGGRVWKSLGVE